MTDLARVQSVEIYGNNKYLSQPSISIECFDYQVSAMVSVLIPLPPIIPAGEALQKHSSVFTFDVSNYTESVIEKMQLTLASGEKIYTNYYRNSWTSWNTAKVPVACHKLDDAKLQLFNKSGQSESYYLVRQVGEFKWSIRWHNPIRVVEDLSEQ